MNGERTSCSSAHDTIIMAILILFLSTVAGLLCESSSSSDDAEQCSLKPSKLQCLQVSENMFHFLHAVILPSI